MGVTLNESCIKIFMNLAFRVGLLQSTMAARIVFDFPFLSHVI